VVLDDPTHIEDLTTTGAFIAGTISTSVSSMQNLFDVLVSLGDRRIMVMSHATASMKMCSIHKEVVSVIMDKSSSMPLDASLQTQFDGIVQPIYEKTMSIINILKSLSSDESKGKKITEQSIISATSNETTQQWLRRLAIVESLL